METFKLKVIVGNAQVELEGNGELVQEIFRELKENGLGRLASSIEKFSSSSSDFDDSAGASQDIQKTEHNENTKNTLPLSGDDLPTLENIVLQGTPKTEAEWLLVYSMYCSCQGTSLFTRDDLRAKYDETNRMTATRSKNFASNVKSLVTSKYISAVNADEFRLEKAGLAKAKNIILDSTDGKKGKRNNSSKKRTPATYNMLDLDLSKEQRASFRNFWDKHSHTANMDKAVLAAYWLKKEKNTDDFTADHLFTLLRTIQENTSFDLAAAIRNAKNNKNYFIFDSTNGFYKLHHIGEDHISALEIGEETNK